jgi:hypothetical protein
VPRSRLLVIALVALPAVLLGIVGLLHPIFLTPETAERWRLAHLLLLPVFPLVGGSVWVLLLGERGAPAWGARVLAFAYAVLYSALDAVAGVGASHQVQRSAARGDDRPPIEDLFEIGDRLGQLGVAALAVSVVLAAVVVLRRHGGPLAPVGAVVAVVGCWLFYRHHVFPPRGVVGVLLLAVGLALIGTARWRVPSAAENSTK